MGRLLCKLGFHSFAYWFDAKKVTYYTCKRCGIVKRAEKGKETISATI